MDSFLIWQASMTVREAGICQPSTLTPLSKSSTLGWWCMTKVTLIIIHRLVDFSLASLPPGFDQVCLIHNLRCVTLNIWRTVPRRALDTYIRCLMVRIKAKMQDFLLIKQKNNNVIMMHLGWLVKISPYLFCVFMKTTNFHLLKHLQISYKEMWKLKWEMIPWAHTDLTGLWSDSYTTVRIRHEPSGTEGSLQCPRQMTQELVNELRVAWTLSVVHGWCSCMGQNVWIIKCKAFSAVLAF